MLMNMKTVIHGGNTLSAALKAKIAPTSLLDFSANINPLGVPSELKKVLTAALDEINVYPDPEYRLLKQSLAQHFQITDKSVFVGNGATQLIFQIACSLRQKVALVLAPTFGEYERALQQAQFKVEHYYLEAKNNFTLNMDDFIYFLKAAPQIKVICLANPNNPTGCVLAFADLQKLVAFCNQTQRYLIFDEAFIALTWPSARSYVNQLTSHDNVYLIHSATKFFAIPGLRLGYCFVKKPQLQTLLRQYSEPWSVNILAARFGAAMFQAQQYIAETQRWLQTELGWMFQQLSHIRDLTVFPSRTNFFLLKTKHLDLQTALLTHRLLIRQCSDYEGLDEHYFRVAVKSHQDNQRLIKYLQLLMTKEG